MKLRAWAWRQGVHYNPRSQRLDCRKQLTDQSVLLSRCQLTQIRHPLHPSQTYMLPSPAIEISGVKISVNYLDLTR
jgi:hypothetical protein